MGIPASLYVEALKPPNPFENLHISPKVKDWVFNLVIKNKNFKKLLEKKKDSVSICKYSPVINGFPFFYEIITIVSLFFIWRKRSMSTVFTWYFMNSFSLFSPSQFGKDDLLSFEWIFFWKWLFSSIISRNIFVWFNTTNNNYFRYFPLVNP